MMVDIAARVPEIGRHDPEEVRAFFVKHADRIFFATDFQVYDRMTLGSGGSGPPPTEADAIDFFGKHWRFFETADRDFPHMTPIQGDWTISAIHLPAEALGKILLRERRAASSRGRSRSCARPRATVALDPVRIGQPAPASRPPASGAGGGRSRMAATSHVKTSSAVAAARKTPARSAGVDASRSGPASARTRGVDASR